MPGWSGHQTLIALKQHSAYRVLPVVMMSADATFSEVTSSYWAGDSTYLVKPLDLNGLHDSLQVAYQYVSPLGEVQGGLRKEI